MSTQLAIVNPKELALQIAAAHEQMGSDTGDFQYLKFRKGFWEFGADDIEVEEGSEWALHPQSYQKGFIAWEKGNTADGPVGEEMQPMLGGVPIQKSDLPQVNGKWGEQLSVLMVCVSGEDEGTQVEFKISSDGGLKKLKRIFTEIFKQTKIEPSKSMPVVTLGSSSYKHKNPEYGKVHVPEMEIVEWVSLNEVDFSKPEDEDQDEPDIDDVLDADEVEEAEIVDEEKPAPKKRRRKAAASEPAAEEEKPARTKRTRRVRK